MGGQNGLPVTLFAEHCNTWLAFEFRMQVPQADCVIFRSRSYEVCRKRRYGKVVDAFAMAWQCPKRLTGLDVKDFDLFRRPACYTKKGLASCWMFRPDQAVVRRIQLLEFW